MDRPYYRCQCGRKSKDSLFDHAKEAKHMMYFERTDGGTVRMYNPPGGSSFNNNTSTSTANYIPGAPDYAQPGWEKPKPTSAPSVSTGYVPGSYIPGAPDYAQPGWVNPNTPAPTAPAPTAPAPTGGTAPRPAAPVDTRTQAEKERDFYAAYNSAIDKAIAGDPTEMKNLDRFFNNGVERPAIGYTPEYLQLERRAQAAGVSIDQQKANEAMAAGLPPEDPRNAAVNALGVSQEMKTKVIAENLAIQAGVRESDSVDNLVAWFNAGGPPDPRTVAYTNSSAQNRNNVINATNLSQEMKTNVIAENLAIQAGVRESDSVDNLVAWFNAGGPQDPRTANWASSATPENQIAVVNATNISQDFKNKVIAEIQAGSNTSDSVYDKISWFERGNPSSAAALAILNPPADKPISAPTPPTSGTPLVDPVTEADVEASAPAPPEAEDALASSQGNSEEHRQDEEAHAKAAAAQAEADEKQAAALALATANKTSAREERIRKINEMRKPWMGGAASSSSGSDAMVVPPITPASQVPPPPFQ